ncbi:transposase [Mycobacterium sherrisii]|nr:transposase [Mycobacterium sherrisii]
MAIDIVGVPSCDGLRARPLVPDALKKRKAATLWSLLGLRVLVVRLAKRSSRGPTRSQGKAPIHAHDNVHGADHTTLASVAGLAPVPHDTGRITGNVKRPRRYNRRLLRVCYMAADNSLRTNPNPGRSTSETSWWPTPSRPSPGQTPHQRHLGTAARQTTYEPNALRAA